MCRINYFKSPQCSHRWMTIAKPCKKGAGFDTCPMFKPGGRIQNGVTRPKKALKKHCPECDKDGEYDPNAVKVVTTHNYKCRKPGTQGENEYHSVCNVM